MQQLPSIQDLRRLLDYDPDTGIFIWNERREGDPDYKRFNARYAGTPAGRRITNGYYQIRIFGIAYQSHRLAWAIFHGDWPARDIDHIDGNPSNNRINNLREASRSQNSLNHQTRLDSSSGEPCIYRVRKAVKPTSKQWRVDVRYKDGSQFVRYFHTLDEAIAARNSEIAGRDDASFRRYG